MKKLIGILLIMLFPAVPLAGGGGYLEVSAPGNRLLQLAIPPAQPLGATSDTGAAREIVEILRFDLTLAGPFTVTTPASGGTTGIRSGEFDLKSWQAAGADLLIKSGYSASGDTMTVELRLFDVFKGKELVAKRYSGSRRDLRRMVHTFSDEVMLAMTGERGPFTGKIAFVSTQTGNKEICLMDYDGHTVQKLTRNGSINLNPDFAPSGKEIIYTSYRKGNPDLYRRELFSGTEAPVSSKRGINITATWSPDGKRIALARSVDGNAQIFLISRDGADLARLTQTHSIEVSPSWSPDGSRIAFVSDRLGKPQVFVMNADGSAPRRLTTSGSYNVSPRWSPKGDRIAYCRQAGSGFQIFTISPDGSNDTQLTTAGSNEHPRWSPDGRFITFSSRRGGEGGNLRDASRWRRADPGLPGNGRPVPSCLVAALVELSRDYCIRGVEKRHDLCIITAIVTGGVSAPCYRPGKGAER